MAFRQWGNITAQQLVDIGFSRREIHWMVERGLLHRRHRGVYAFGAPSRAPESRWAAALLAAGEGSALGRTAAAGFYGQLPVRGVIEIVAPKQRRGDKTLKIYTAKRFEAIERRGTLSRLTAPPGSNATTRSATSIYEPRARPSGAFATRTGTPPRWRRGCVPFIP